MTERLFRNCVGGEGTGPWLKSRRQLWPEFKFRECCHILLTTIRKRKCFQMKKGFSEPESESESR